MIALNVAQATAARDDEVRRLTADGAQLKSVAEAAGVTVSYVKQITGRGDSYPL